MNISDVKQANAGDEVSLTGTLTRVFDRKTGTGKGRKWSIQNAMLSDPTGEIRLSVWNHPDMQPLTHTEVRVSGAEAEDNDYNGKVTRQIKIEESGIIVASTASTNSIPNTTMATEPTIILINGKEEMMKHLDELARQASETYEIAFARAFKSRDTLQKKFEIEMPNDQFQAMVSAIFINISRQGESAMRKL
jgi:hypothetical protein